MKSFSLPFLGALTGVLVCLAPSISNADDYDKKTVVKISERTEVPGLILEPGTYVIRLLNSSSNRHVAEIMNERMDHLYALTFTVAAERINRADKTILSFYEQATGRPQALRKWFWPGETNGQEFIYPKDQAARISAATKKRVPEGNLPTVAESKQSLIPDNAKGLSSDATEKNNETETSLAARAPEPVTTPEPERATEPPPVIAQNSPAPQSQRADETREPDSAVALSSNRTSTTSESAANESSERALPQTASHLPLIGAIGIVSLTLALFVAAVKRRRTL